LRRSSVEGLAGRQEGNLKGKRITRREIKEDALVTFAFRAVEFVKKERSRLILGGVIAVLAVVGTLYVTSSRRAGEEEASEQLLAGMVQQNAGNDLGAAAAYEELLSRHSRTRSGKMALLFLGHARYNLGQYGAALDAYQRYLKREKRDKLTVGQAKRASAACLENTGKFEDAAGMYEDVARSVDEGDAVADDLMAAARCWKLAGVPDRAIELLQEIVDSYPKYQNLDRAKIVLAELQYSSSE
jgi:tetratricopeptide (TPR) repeat protein